jgi:hypothetical protein
MGMLYYSERAVGLKAGTYIVNINGITDTFQLQVDNILD